MSRRDAKSAREAWLGESAEKCSETERLVAILEDAEGIERHSKLAAGSLALLPGAGYMVTGQKQTALATLIINGLLIGGAVEAFHEDLEFLGATFSVFALGWYSGSIYGSVSSVDRIYESRWENALSGADLDSY